MYKDDEEDIPEFSDGRSVVSYATVAYALFSAVGTGVGLLLWQVWINTGRLDRLETRADAFEKEVPRIEKMVERSDDKQEGEILRLQSRIDQLELICEELKIRKALF